ncbi:MAG: hypothetical protein HPY62_11350 [Bacteroidales bacterium]|nr:hypothetical protein [Bacteroidales bacterium]
MSQIGRYLQINASAQSADYIENKKQFHLFSLLTEQRHPATMNLSQTVRKSTLEGLKMLLSVDNDICRKIEDLSKNPQVLYKASEAIVRAVRNRHRIYFYGCGSTGRLAKFMESTLWRPFWRKIKESPVWAKAENHLPHDIENYLTGEMTGADRALISSLEGFEDLQLIGRLQLLDRGVRKGDVVFCVTEGGETSSVIGTILTAFEQYGEPDENTAKQSAENLFFVYNNPDNLLLPFDRSRKVLENKGITKINLATGPQAITGSTRMQATTVETFVLGVVIEHAIGTLLKGFLDSSELAESGFDPELNLEKALMSFSKVKEAADKSAPSLATLTDAEAEAYRHGRYSTYFAVEALVTVFIDCTERSPTFRLHPLDTVDEKEKKSWIRIWTDAKDKKEAWKVLLGRDFRGLDQSFYKSEFETEIDDPYLKRTALNSLENAGNDQQLKYDLSFSEDNKLKYKPGKKDIGIIACLSDEIESLNDPDSGFSKFIQFFSDAQMAIIRVYEEGHSRKIQELSSNIIWIDVILPRFPDPLGLRKQIALKMLLNAHSTAIMAMLGRVIGNTMTSVNPSNLKLIGRATYLIMSHVNNIISGKKWIKEHGQSDLLTFEEANTVLFDAIDYISSIGSGQTAEVALSIIRILEALKSKDFVSWSKAHSILESAGLEQYLNANSFS